MTGPSVRHGFLFPLILDRRLWRSALPWALALFFGANVAVGILAETFHAERRANLLAAIPSVPIANPSVAAEGEARFDRSVGEDLGAFWPRIPDARRSPLVILSGMSQMYAINDKTTGDQTISEHLDDALRPRGARVFGLAAPNLSNEEELLLLLASVDGERTRPAVWIFGLCFDKFRNVDLRPGYQRFLRERPELLRRWKHLAEGKAGRCSKATDKMLDTSRTLMAAKTQDSDTLESRLRRETGAVLPVVGERRDLNAGLQLGSYLFRNWVFGIKPTSKRPVIPYRYDLNREFIELLVEEAAASDVRLLMYVIPLNPQSDNPYVPAEYQAFKDWAAELCRSRGIPFENFENVVPAAQWGEFNGGPDFKHFRGEGHRVVARAILERFATELPTAVR